MPAHWHTPIHCVTINPSAESKLFVQYKMSPWWDVTRLARHRLLPLVSYVASWSATDIDRWQTTTTDDDWCTASKNNTGPYTMCRRASNNKPKSWYTALKLIIHRALVELTCKTSAAWGTHNSRIVNLCVTKLLLVNRDVMQPTS